MWHIHTTARQILATGTRFIMIKPVSITAVTVAITEIFVFSVIALCSTKLSKCFLYSDVPINQSCNLFELLAKQKTVAK